MQIELTIKRAVNGVTSVAADDAQVAFIRNALVQPKVKVWLAALIQRANGGFDLLPGWLLHFVRLPCPVIVSVFDDL